ncbi:putative GDP-mannose 4,6 dehydratase [Trypanosoma cruzi]|uniref:GDP-mannose 4,6-dehydratase n=1 Tax=Trypanosoma cruzi TaxID=5693 RepID=A0A2V2X982_TRYCR|nr:putative GDP-mannose 4,6 dehydratase [Trypanosoma cruzi]
MFACNGILFNHESPRRGATFVTKKIVRAAVRIKKGLQKELLLGNVNALRDWGHAKDYVHGMWLMLQAEKPDDWVLATGEQHSVREFCNLTFRKLGYELEWSGSGVDEVAYDVADPKKVPLIRVDPRYFRPAGWKRCLATPARPRENSAGGPRTASGSWWMKWCSRRSAIRKPVRTHGDEADRMCPESCAWGGECA